MPGEDTDTFSRRVANLTIGQSYNLKSGQFIIELDYVDSIIWFELS